MSERKGWDTYFMDIAKVAATRATCTRKHVGAVIVRDRSILSTGYNGSLPGQLHCDQVPEEQHVVNGHCDIAVHAEANAIVQAARRGTAIDGGTIYTTASPCWPCFKLVASSGIKRIVFGELYRDERITKFAEDSKIELLWLRN
jgi:dCMP deaminase